MSISEQRPLFKTGESLAVTLPKAWTKYFHLSAGDKVEIVINEELVIRSVKRVDDQSSSPQSKFHIDLTT
jgi:antitoxin component of MazEF toxin-antitoxin module